MRLRDSLGSASRSADHPDLDRAITHLGIAIRARAYRSSMRSPVLAGVIPLSIVLAIACCGHPPTPAAKPVVAIGDAGAPSNLGTGRCTAWSESDEGADAGGAAGAAASPTDDESAPPTHRHSEPRKAGDLCETADSNLARAEKEILANNEGGPKAAHVAWDHKAKPERFDLVARRLSLTKAERDLLSKNGFVVQSRITHSTYAWGLHEVYQSQLPIYISADSILHAVYTSNDHLLADIERDMLEPLLARTLSAMHCALAEPARSRAYPPEVARDLDLYLTVARSLLADAPVASVLGTDAEASKLLAAAHTASGIENLEMFGRARLIDWSQYQPRGHYAEKKKASSSSSGAPAAGDDEDSSSSMPPDDGKPSLAPYFRAGMWLSRLEFNLVSRSSRSSLLGSPDPRETPREAVVALALSDLVERSHTLDDVARLDHAWALLAGKREDVSVADMIALRKKGAIAAIDLASFDKLKTAIGNDFQRTARLHPMPEGSKVLPAITTFLGPRVVADTAAFRPLVHSEVSERYLVGAGDVAYVLGLDRGKAYLKEDLAKHSELAAKLDEARSTLAKANAPAVVAASGDLYGAWLGALRGVAEKPNGIVPSFMQTTAYDDLRMNTLVAGYGQIRHNYVLMAGQSYDEGGCVIPDGYVEPMPSVYEGIASYAQRGSLLMKELLAGGTAPKKSQAALPKVDAYFKELEKVSRVLARIAHHELEGRALTTSEKRFLSMVVEMTPGSTGSEPTYTGWYFDLFRDRVDEGLAAAAFVADYHTSSFKQKVVYAGALAPRMGIFVIDAGGPPRLAVGPVAHAYEVQSSLEKRLDDQSALKADGKKEPWSASYTAPTPAVPAIAVAATFDDSNQNVRVLVRAGKAPLTNVIVEILDHHGVPFANTTRSVPANGKVRLTFPTSSSRTAEAIRIRIGEFSTERAFGRAESSAAIELGGISVGTDDFR
jgi:hypothetical protein